VGGVLASVSLEPVTSTTFPPAIIRSLSALARPSRISSASTTAVKPCASMRASVQPAGAAGEEGEGAVVINQSGSKAQGARLWLCRPLGALRQPLDRTRCEAIILFGDLQHRRLANEISHLAREVTRLLGALTPVFGIVVQERHARSSPTPRLLFHRGWPRMSSENFPAAVSYGTDKLPGSRRRLWAARAHTPNHPVFALPAGALLDCGVRRQLRGTLKGPAPIWM